MGRNAGAGFNPGTGDRLHGLVCRHAFTTFVRNPYDLSAFRRCPQGRRGVIYRYMMKELMLIIVGLTVFAALVLFVLSQMPTAS
jgi:hypothetical protein